MLHFTLAIRIEININDQQIKIITYVLTSIPGYAAG